MIKFAHVSKPLMDTEKSIVIFQLNFFFNHWMSSSTSIEQINEIARIFKINLSIEPYLVHIVEKIINHFSPLTEKISYTSSSIDDFFRMIVRARTEYNQLSAQILLQSTTHHNRSLDLNCIECRNNMRTTAEIFCNNCNDYFCTSCYTDIHTTGSRTLHQ